VNTEIGQEANHEPESINQSVVKTSQTPQMVVGLSVQVDTAVAGKSLRMQCTVVGWLNTQVLLISAPLVHEEVISLSPGAGLVVRYLHEGMIYGFATTLIKSQKRPIPVWYLEYPSYVEVINMRRRPRIDVLLNAVSLEGQTWHIVNLSGNGALLAVERRISIDETVQFSFTMPDGAEVKDMMARVVRLMETREGRFIGVVYTDGQDEKIAAIEHYVAFYLKNHGMN
jgi:c-di-GMP-binding flagellar brake protein YcgR